ncbi:MAG: hypothetical protein ABEH83_13540 [Halobacterium sp.]
MQRAYVARAVAVVAAATVLLTAAFVGIVALGEGRTAGVSGRVPFYVFGGAVLFVATLVTLEDPEEGGVPILTTTVAVSVLGFALLALAGEGFLYAGRNPESVFGSSLVLYFVAAALVCTGTVYWALNHWREFTA